MQLYIFLAIVTAFLFGVISLLDRHVITAANAGITTVMFLSMISKFIFFTGIYLIFGEAITHMQSFMLSVIAGFLLGAGIMAYYKALSKGPVSILSPITSLEAVVIALLAFFLLEDLLTFYEYLGMFVLLLGVVIMSYNKNYHSNNVLKFVLYGLLGAFIIGTQGFLVDVAGMTQSLPNVLFGIGIGNLIFVLVLSFSEKKPFSSAIDKNIKELLLINCLALIGIVLLYAAILLGPAAIVVALLGLKHAFIFFGAKILEYFSINSLHEHAFGVSDKRKMLGIAIVIFGTVLMTVF